jgi:hypothetical protein
MLLQQLTLANYPADDKIVADVLASFTMGYILWFSNAICLSAHIESDEKRLLVAIQVFIRIFGDKTTPKLLDWISTLGEDQHFAIGCQFGSMEANSISTVSEPLGLMAYLTRQRDSSKVYLKAKLEKSAVDILVK